MINGRHVSSVLDVRRFRGINIDSDRHLVAAKFRLRISAYKKKLQSAAARTNIENYREKKMAFSDRKRDRIGVKVRKSRYRNDSRKLYQKVKYLIKG